jgi:hypothetical protein
MSRDWARHAAPNRAIGWQQQRLYFHGECSRSFKSCWLFVKEAVVMRAQGFGSRALAMAPHAAAELVEEMMQRWKASDGRDKA